MAAFIWIMVITSEYKQPSSNLLFQPTNCNAYSSDTWY